MVCVFCVGRVCSLEDNCSVFSELIVVRRSGPVVLLELELKLELVGVEGSGLGCIGLGCIGLGCIGLDCIGLDCIGLDCIGLDCATCSLSHFLFLLSLFPSHGTHCCNNGC